MFAWCPVCEFVETLFDYEICVRCGYQVRVDDAMTAKARWENEGRGFWHDRLDQAIAVEQQFRALLQECLDYAYNPFEPENQTAHYTKLKAILEKR